MENPEPNESPAAALSGTDEALRIKLQGLTPILLGLGRGGKGGIVFLVDNEKFIQICRVPAPPVEDEHAPLPVIGQVLREHLAAVAAELLCALAPHLPPGFMERLVPPPRMGEQTPQRWDFLAELRAYAATPEGAPLQEMMTRHGL